MIYSIPPLLTLFSYLTLAGLAWQRGLHLQVNRIFFVLCLLGIVMFLDILIIFNTQSAQLALLSSRVGHFFDILSMAVFFHFFHAYLNIGDHRWTVRAVYIGCSMLACFAATPLIVDHMRLYSFGYYGIGGSLYHLILLVAVFVESYCLWMLYGALVRETDSVRRNQLRYVLAGFGLMGFLVALNMMPLYGIPIYPPGCFSFVPLAVFAVGLFRHDLLDMGDLLKHSLRYSLLTVVLTGMYAIMIIVAGQWLGGADSLLFGVLFFLLITFVFEPVKTGIQKLIDRLPGGGKTHYRQTVTTASHQIAGFLDSTEIRDCLVDIAVNTIQASSAAVYIFDAQLSHFAYIGAANDKWPPHLSMVSEIVAWLRIHPGATPRKRLMRRHAPVAAGPLLAQLNALRVDLILPMYCRSELIGAILLGPKATGGLYPTSDINLLETLVAESALAFENARAYKLIEALNKNLEKKVAQRTHELENALREKERTQEQLIRSESLAAIGQLVAGAAHELNNPLTSVTSLIQAVLEDLQAPAGADDDREQWRDDLSFADQELARARRIVASLLDLSRQTQTYTETVDINIVVQDALRVLHNQYKHSQIQIITHMAADLPRIDGNFANLGQVMINIVKNAIQAVDPETGQIELTTGHDPAASKIYITCRDNGPGVADDKRTDIFKPFFTTKPVGQGTGLGLYISHEIVKKHGGVILLDTADDGATFKIELPVARTEGDR